MTKCAPCLVPFDQLCSGPTHAGPLQVDTAEDNNGLRGMGNIVNIPLMLYLHSQVTVFPIDQIQMQFRCGTTHSANCIMFLQFFVFILNVFDFKMSLALYIYLFLFLICVLNANMLNMWKLAANIVQCTVSDAFTERGS